jgi:hypothetical protein
LGALMRGVLAGRARTEPAPDEVDEPAVVPVPGRRTRTAAIDWEAVDPPGAGVAAVQRREAGGDAPAVSVVLAAAARGVSTGGGGLPHASTIQRLFGRHDVSVIEAHVGDNAGAAARAMGARGFATGHHVVFAGAPDLFTAAHEAAHVVQQRGGVQLSGGVGEVGDMYEQHANEVAERIVRGESAEALLDRVAPASAAAPATGPVQQMMAKRAKRGESPDERIDRLTGEVAPARVRAVVAELVRHGSGPGDGGVRAAYAASAAAAQHGKVASAAEAADLALHARIAGNAVALAGLLNDAKIASGAELRGLLGNAKIASRVELESLLAEVNIVSGAELAALLASPKVGRGADLLTLVQRPICPSSTALVAFFADAHIPSLVEVDREIATGEITAWGQWAARSNVTNVAVGLGPAPDLAAFRAMSAAQVYTHTQANAAWHAGIALPADRDQIRALLDLLRNTDGALEGCGTFNAGRLYDEVVTRGGSAGNGGAHIRAYARAVEGKATCPSEAAGTIADAFDRGRDVVALEGVLDPRLLHDVFTAKALDDLCASGFLADFITYVRTCAPMLSAREGKEIKSYLALRRETVDPVALHAGLTGWVVNLHRFHARALAALGTAVAAGNTGRLPVTVLIHSGQDREGAFHRDRNLADVITRGGHYTLMLEGQGDLATVSGKLATIAATHGPGGKIANVMLVGHGQPRSIDITGTTAADGTETPTGVSLKRTAGRDFLCGLIDQMASGPGAHLLLDACHTDSNEVEQTPGLGTTNSWSDDAQKIRDYIRAKPSLAKFARSYAAGKVQQLAVHGANGATRDGNQFLDRTGQLTLFDPRDPQLSGTKLAYVEHGQDPKGVMRAVLEEWATTNRGAALDSAMRRRMAVVDDDFRNQVIRTLFGLIVNGYWATAADIARMVNVAGAVKKLRYSEDCTLGKLQAARLRAQELTALHRDLQGTRDWTRVPFLSIVFDQEMNQPAAVVAKLGTMTTQIRELIRSDRHYIGSTFPFAGQLSLGSVATASVGQVTLAIIGLKQHTNTDARAFLQAYVAQLVAPVVPAHLGNLASLQRDLGPVAGPAPKSANLAIDGQLSKTLHVEPLTKRGTTTRNTGAYPMPDIAAGVAAPIMANTTVLLIGQLPGWYAVEGGQQTGYVPSADVAVP